MIPFLNLKIQLQGIRTDILEATEEGLDSEQFILSETVTRFEQAFAVFSGAENAISVNSGTSALHLALLAAGT